MKKTLLFILFIICENIYSAYYPLFNDLQQTYVWSGRGGYTSAYTTGSPSSSSLTVTLPGGATV